MKYTKVEARSDAQTFTHETTGHLTSTQVSEALRPFFDAHPPTWGRMVTVTHSSTLRDRLTTVADAWLSVPGWVRYSLYVLAALALGFGLRLF